jgi:hypothetical protein
VIREHDADEIEEVLIDAGAAVATSRSVQEWLSHPRGRAVALEPIVDRELSSDAPFSGCRPQAGPWQASACWTSLKWCRPNGYPLSRRVRSGGPAH